LLLILKALLVFLNFEKRPLKILYCKTKPSF